MKPLVKELAERDEDYIHSRYDLRKGLDWRQIHRNGRAAVKIKKRYSDMNRPRHVSNAVMESNGGSTSQIGLYVESSRQTTRDVGTQYKISYLRKEQT